jgi:hypothetical protein
VLPLGCYDIGRFESEHEMAAQIIAMSSPDIDEKAPFHLVSKDAKG